MAREKSSFVCGECGYVSLGWLGQCPECGQWNTINRELVSAIKPSRRAGQSTTHSVSAPQTTRLSEVDPGAEVRLSTGLGELDRVLGGGLVSGSVVLLGGEPGIGKSTILLQALLNMGTAETTTLLVSGEESSSQVKLRSTRLQGNEKELRLLCETQTEAVISCLEELRPSVCVVDSIQTLWSGEVGSVPGSVAQIREAASQLVRVGKTHNIALFVVGHVTKEGELAGPRVLEHMVDTVLYFEGERSQPFRILRAAKNRFGSTNEVGIFQMTERGLAEVSDPSSLFLEERDLRSGSAVVPVLEGSRCLLAEVQALVTPSNLAVPQRVSRGVDRNRLTMIAAVLARRARIPILKCDIFVNVGGGLTLADPSADLAVALAIVSAWRDTASRHDIAAFGELSLTGRVRYALQGEKRIQELVRRGFRWLIIPVRNAKEVGTTNLLSKEIRADGVLDISQAVEGISVRTGHE